MNICLYAPIKCDTGKACLDGTCQDSPLSFSVKPTKAAYPWQSDGMFWTGHVDFSATLKNVSTQPVIVSASDNLNVEVASVSKLDASRERILVERRALLNFREVEPTQPRDSSIRTLGPGQEVGFTIRRLGTIFSPEGMPEYAVHYLSSTTGHYTTRFIYRYNGTLKDVYRGAVWSNGVSFDLQ